MSFRALRFAGQELHASPIQSELNAASRQAFRKSLSPERPAVYAVRNQDLDKLREFADLIIDRGRKHKAKQLASIMLGQKRIPLVSGSYTSTAQLVHSVRSLLLNAAREDDRNIYVIGADDEVFEKLWDKTGAAARKRHARRRAGKAADACIISDRLGDLLPPLPVPPELENGFIGTSRASQLIRQLILRAADSIEDVLILGDTGTGKEVVAACICDQSGRRPFVPFNCAAHAGDHLEAALFGEESNPADRKGSQLGSWQMAGDGTLFLDEIGGLQMHHQVKILRALERREVRPVGSKKDVPVPARVIAASNRDLFALMQTGQFREDLYYRLRSFTIRIPPLRTHREDIPCLAQSFWKAITWDKGSGLPLDILAALQSRDYRWPGNARELKAVLSALHALFGKDDLRLEHLQAVLQDLGQTSASERAPATAGAIGQARIDSLRHLHHVDEVIRACLVTLRPVLEKKHAASATVAAVHGALHYRLHELESLCMHPQMFDGDATFLAVNSLKGKLAYFHSLLQSSIKEALRYWKKAVAQELQSALSALGVEVERVMESV